MPQEPLPELRHYTANAVEVINDTIYMCGGTIADDRRSTATREINDVLYTTVRKDGTLSPWKRSAPFGAPRTLLATAHTPTHLYITGGARQRPLDDIISATILPNGDLGPWTSIGRLPRPLWFHGAAILDNRMYIWGGLTGPKNSTASNAVWSAEVNRDGSLGQWRPEVPMPVGIYSAANSGFNDYLVTIGGRLAGGQPTNDITVAKLERGRVGRWQTLPTDLHTRYFHSLGLDETRGWIFVTGGRLRREPTDNSRILVNEVRGFQVSNSPAPPSPVLAKLGFLDPATARTKALGLGNRSILLYFRSPEVPSCQRFEESLQSSELVASHLSGIVPAVVDVSKDPQLSYNYGIFKVPSVAIVGPSGTLIRSATSLRTANDLIEFLRR
jgi:hypothetical protein